MDNKIIMAGALLIGILVIAGLIYSGTGAAVVSAMGESSLDVNPDRVSVNLNIEARDETAQEAKNKHDEILDNLIVGLLKAGLERDDIKTVNYNIYPDYVWENNKREQRGFVASQQIVIELEDFDLVTGVVDAAVDAGALVSYINFELSQEKQSEYKALVLEEAGKDARKKAEAIATGLGKNLGGLVSVKSQDFSYIPFRYFDAAEGAVTSEEAKQAAINLAPSDIEVRASLIVEYKLSRF